MLHYMTLKFQKCWMRKESFVQQGKKSGKSLFEVAKRENQLLRRVLFALLIDL